MAARAKEDRDEWEIKLICALEELDLVVSGAKSKRVLEIKIREVEKIFEGLQKSHAVYCQKAKIGLGSSDSTEYIKGQVKIKVKGISAAKMVISEEDEGSESADMIRKLEGEQFQLKVEIEGKLSSLEGMTATPLLNTEQYDSIMEMLSDCDTNVKKYMECSDFLENSCDQAESKKLKSESQTFFQTSNKKLVS